MLLTKSKYMMGLNCPRHLWMAVHEKEKLPADGPDAKYRMKQGQMVGQLAKSLYPNGVDVAEDDFKENLKKTKESLKGRKCIFEAGILCGSLYGRADILIPVGSNEWDILEVKSSTEPKEEHGHDLSFQKHVYEKSGLNIRNCLLAHINREFIKEGEIDPKRFFAIVNLNEEVAKASVGIEERIKSMLSVISKSSPPNVKIGDGCSNGFDCPCNDCWNFLPKENVFELYRGGKKSLELFQKGVLNIKDIPKSVKLTNNQKIQIDCAKSKKTYIDKKSIKKFLSALQEPIHYMDFETYNTAIPLFDGTRPYQQIPFQFSVHEIMKKKKSHHEFLADGKDDPRPKFLTALKKALGDSGTIVAFNAGFEMKVLSDLAQSFPQSKEWYDSIIPRIVDLLIPFRQFDYYNPMQKGSASMKKVLPAMTRKGYGELEIGDGGTASTVYLDMIFGEMDESTKEKVKCDLLIYCCLDTEGMVWIVEELKKVSE